jgi:tetratricopeptide (TPR) repeat protein
MPIVGPDRPSVTAAHAVRGAAPRGAFVLLLLALSGPAPVVPRAEAAQEARSTHDLLQAGTAALEESNFARAGARFHEAIDLDPHLAQAYYGLGLAAIGQRDRRQAERSLRQAGDLTGGAPETVYALGVARFVFDDPRGAEDLLRGAARADKLLVEARFALGIAAAVRGELDDAAAALREAIRVDASMAEAHYQLGAVLARQGDLDGALAEMSLSLRSNPSILDARLEDPIGFAPRLLQPADAATASLQMPLPVLRPSIAWPRSRGSAGSDAARADIPAWFLYYQMALELEALGAWRGSVDMLERALALKDRSETGARIGDRLVDYTPHLHLATAYERLGNAREASLHLGIARNEGNASPVALQALEVLIRRDRLRPRIVLQPLPDRTADDTVTVRGLVISDEPVQRVEVGGREAILRTPTAADLSDLLAAADPSAPKEPMQATLFEVPGYRLDAPGLNIIPIRPLFRNPGRDGDLIEVRVVRDTVPPGKTGARP